MSPAITGFMQLETPIHRIAEDHAVPAFERHAIEEPVGIAVLHRQGPGAAAINGPIYT